MVVCVCGGGMPAIDNSADVEQGWLSLAAEPLKNLYAAAAVSFDPDRCQARRQTLSSISLAGKVPWLFGTAAMTGVAIVCGSSHLLTSGRGADCPRARTRRARRLRAGPHPVGPQAARHLPLSLPRRRIVPCAYWETNAKNALVINDAAA